MTTDYASRCARIMAIYREDAEDAALVAEIQRRRESRWAEHQSLMPDHLRDTDAFIAAMRRPK